MDDPRFDHLLGRLLDDSLSPDELVELAGLLRGHPERQQRLQDQLEAADWIAQAVDDLRDSRRFVAATLARTAENPFVSKVAAPPLSVTTSTPNTPVTDRVASVAVVVES